MQKIIEEAHKRFEEYKNHAEQHDFLRILAWEGNEKFAYVDLLAHPDNSHCITYLKLIHKFVNCQDLLQQLLAEIRNSKVPTINENNKVV